MRLALRIVSYVYFRLREESARHGLKLVLEDVAGTDAAERFVKIDGQLYPRARGLLVDRTRYTLPYRINSVYWTSSGGTSSGGDTGKSANLSPPGNRITDDRNNPYVQTYQCRGHFFAGSQRAQEHDPNNRYGRRCYQ